MKGMTGRVVVAKLPKTVTVLVERKEVHPLYKKSFVRSKKYLVDDPVGVKMGDLVEIVKMAPLSKRKHFRVAKVVGKSLVEITEVTLKEAAKGAIEEVMPEEKEGQGESGKGEVMKEVTEQKINRKNQKEEKAVEKGK